MSDTAPSAASQTGRMRWVVIAMLFLAITINYIDRVNVSVAGNEIAREFGLGPGALGLVFSSFFWSYLILIVPMGLLADRWGARAVITGGMVLWAVGATATGLALGLGTLIGARLLLGAGESSGYPAANRIVREWSPRSERGAMVAVFNSGSTAGPAVGIVVTTALLSVVSWRTAFVLVGAGTLIWVGIWWAFYRSPERARWLSAPERAHILATREPETRERVDRMSFAALLRQPVMWGLLLTHGCQVYVIYLFLTWLPTYLQNVRGLNLSATGILGMLPYLITTIGLWGIGWLSDRLMRRADPSTGARRKLMVVLMVLAACVFFLPQVRSLWLMELLLTASVLFSTAANTVNYALAADLVHDRESAGAAFGLLVLGGNAFGFVAPIVTGFTIARTHTYDASFVIAAALLLIGVVITLTMVRRPLQPKGARTASAIATPATRA